jgi:hypothetical protein
MGWTATMSGRGEEDIFYVNINYILLGFYNGVLYRNMCMGRNVIRNKEMYIYMFSNE